MALAADVVWEVRTDGDDNNGGGFNSSSSGTDYSQQAAAQLTVTDAATSGVGSTTLTSATGGFTSAMVGNVVHLYGGTNLTDGWYEITGFTDTNTVTLDRAPDDGVGGVSGATCKVGGALASPGGLGAAWANAAVTGQYAWMKAGTYTMTNGSDNVSGGHLVFPSGIGLILEGYNATRGDRAGRPTIVQSGSYEFLMQLASGNTTSQAIIHLGFDAGGYYNSYGIKDTGGQSGVAIDCSVVNGNLSASMGFRDNITAIGCYVESHNKGYQCFRTIGCRAKSCVTGFGQQYVYDMHVADIADGGTVGFDQNGQKGGVFSRCVAYNNSSDGFVSVSGKGTSFVSCIAVNNGGYGFNLTADHLSYNCSGFGNTSGNYTATARILNWLTITADPFVDAPNGDFRLNDTAGAGAVLRGAGLGVYGQTDNKDVGAVQHSDAIKVISGGGCARLGY